MNLIESDTARFQAFLCSPNENECILWRGYCTAAGYGQFMVRGKIEYSHRVALVLSGQKLLPGDYVLHSCDIPSCCNPAHLRIGTHQDNMRDMKERRRGTGGRHGLPRGVHRARRGVKYKAQLGYKGRSKYLGRYTTVQEAEQAIVDFEETLCQ